jgi:hypothetical protein
VLLSLAEDDLWADVTAVEAGFVDQASALLAVVLPPPDVWDEREALPNDPCKSMYGVCTREHATKVVNYRQEIVYNIERIKLQRKYFPVAHALGSDGRVVYSRNTLPGRNLRR